MKKEQKSTNYKPARRRDAHIVHEDRTNERDTIEYWLHQPDAFAATPAPVEQVGIESQNQTARFLMLIRFEKQDSMTELYT